MSKRQLALASRVLTIALFYGIAMARGGAFAATDVWSSHMTNVQPWKTTIHVFLPESGPTTTVTLDKYDGAGNQIGASKSFAVIPLTWTVIGPAELDYDGSAHFTSAADLLVKVTFQYGDSHSLCEFYLTDAQGTAWILPNSLHDWFTWTGVAIVNPNPAPVTATLEAYRAGARIGTKTASLSPREKYAALSDSIWFGLRYQDFDTVILRTSLPVPAPISITGDTAGDRHVFFTAQRKLTGSAVPTEGLTGYYPFSGNANDLSGNNRHAVVYGATPTADRFGNANSAYVFDGATAYISLADGETGNLRTSGTLAFWCKADEQNFTDGRVHKVFEKDLGPWWAFYIAAYSNYLTLTVSPDNFASYVVNVLPRDEWLNRWAFVAVVKSGRVYDIYANGRLVSSQTFPVDQIVNNQTMTWGRSNYWRSQYFKGALDDTRIYNRALTASEIQALYREGGWGQ